MNMLRSPVSALALCSLLAACSTTTSISSTRADTRMLIKDTALTLPARRDLRGTSFGNYEFEARHDGGAALHGILPLKFKGGNLALDILFFAPAAFFNLRAAFPFYEVDIDNGIIRYKEKRGDAWIDYTPTLAEAERARDYYRERAAKRVAE